MGSVYPPLRKGEVLSLLQKLTTDGLLSEEQFEDALTDAVVGIGLGAVMGAGMQGGLTGMRTASATVQGINTVRSAEQARGSLVNVTDTVALAQRSAQLQRAHVEKGC